MSKISLFPIATQFTFSFPKDPIKKTWINRKLFGFRDKSKFGSYEYTRESILQDQVWFKSGQNSVVVRRTKEAKLRVFCKVHAIQFSERLVVLSKREAQKMGISSPSPWRDVIEDLKGSPDFVVAVDF